MVYNTKGSIAEELFPGVTYFENKLGGKIFVFSGTPQANFNLVEAFSFLNYSRKQQFIKMLSELNMLTVFYPGDEDMYMKAAIMDEDKLFVALTNICLDNIYETMYVYGNYSYSQR